MFIRTTAIIAVLTALLGCDQKRGVSHPEGEITRLEIYYRNFDSLSPISHSKSDLIRAAPFKLNINEADSIRDFLRILPDQCDHLPDMSEEKIDYYLLAKMLSEERLDREFGSSGLSFVDSKRFPGKVCRLSQHDREAIDTWLQAELADMASTGNDRRS